MSRRRPRRQRGDSSDRNRVLLGLLLGIALTLVATGTVAGQAAHVEDLLMGSSVDQLSPNETLYIEAGEAAYLNRIYRERSHEIAFCGLIDDEAQPRLEVWLADTVRASPETVEFLTSNCPPNTGALLHTHPNGMIGLSARDRQALADRPEEIACIQAGQLATEPSTRLSNLACYKQLNPSTEELTVARIPVVVMNTTVVG